MMYALIILAFGVPLAGYLWNVRNQKLADIRKRELIQRRLKEIEKEKAAKGDQES